MGENKGLMALEVIIILLTISLVTDMFVRNHLENKREATKTENISK